MYQWFIIGIINGLFCSDRSLKIHTPVILIPSFNNAKFLSELSCTNVLPKERWMASLFQIICLSLTNFSYFMIK